MTQKSSTKSKNEILKTLPSVRELLESTDLVKFQIPYAMIIGIARQTILETRNFLTNNSENTTVSSKDIYSNFKRELKIASNPHLNNVINGTGIILHTGMGRAPFSKELVAKCSERLTGYTNLEFDLSNGKRGERLSHVEHLLSALTGSEQAVVVNNNAAAVLICLNTFGDGKEVIISRGQMVEIGGSFRIPDVIEKSGAKIKEIGTTNRTHLTDYERHINPNTGVILTAHTSNYTIKGFTKTPDMETINALSKKHKIPHVIDLGSGALVDMVKMNMPDEPQVRSYIGSGASLVTFSGDKLLGGPQAGIICGNKSLIKKIKKNALYRALRCDKLTLMFLEETLRTYYTDSSIHSENLTWSLFSRQQNSVEELGHKIISGISKKVLEKSGIKLQESKVEAGSGSLPVENLDSMELLFQPKKMKAMEVYQSFLSLNPPIVGYIHAKKFRIDLKAVPESQFKNIQSSIIKVFS